MKSDCHQLFSIYTLIIMQVISAVLAVCPKNALDQFQQCTTKVLPDLSQSSLSQGPNALTKQVKDASDSCRDSRLQDATDCIKDILDRCNGDSKDEQTLRRLVDKDRTLKTVEYFCKNLRGVSALESVLPSVRMCVNIHVRGNVYEKNAECIFRHHEEVKTCSENAMKTMKSKIKSGASFDVLISESCRFHSTARSCLTRTTEIRCGQEAADFVFQLLTGTLPPHCDSDDFDEGNPEYTPYDGNRRTSGAGDQNGNFATANLPPFKLTILFTISTWILKTIR